MTLGDKITAFEKLGIFLEQFDRNGSQNILTYPWLEELNDKFLQPLELLIKEIPLHNPWFTEENVRFALGSIGRSLNAEDLSSWLRCYKLPSRLASPKTVAVIMAGNIPLVGFHDMLCVLISGHRLLARLSSKDDKLPKIIAEIICFIDKGFNDKIILKDGFLKGFDAVIATGSNNTSRYFEYYFGRYPHIIRKNRNSVAILDGFETPGDLILLSNDVFRYFGLGCRNVSKIFVPSNYDFTPLSEAFACYRYLGDHNKWANNYEYQRAIHLIDQITFMDMEFFILREEKVSASPISVINYEETASVDEAMEIIEKNRDQLQCIISRKNLRGSTIPPGKSQEPRVNEYADNADTLEFLLKLHGS